MNVIVACIIVGIPVGVIIYLAGIVAIAIAGAAIGIPIWLFQQLVSHT